MSNRNVKGADAKAPTVVITKAQRDAIESLGKLVIGAQSHVEAAEKKLGTIYEQINDKFKDMGVSPNVLTMSATDSKETTILVAGDPMTVAQFRRSLDEALAYVKLSKAKQKKLGGMSEYECWAAPNNKGMTDAQQESRESSQNKMGPYRQRLKKAAGLTKSGGGGVTKTDGEKIETMVRSIIKICRNDDTTLSEEVSEVIQTAAFSIGCKVNKQFKFEK